MAHHSSLVSCKFYCIIKIYNDCSECISLNIPVGKHWQAQNIPVGKHKIRLPVGKHKNNPIGKHKKYRWQAQNIPACNALLASDFVLYLVVALDHSIGVAS